MLYAVKLPKCKKWDMTRNKRVAIRAAKRYGAEVYAHADMPEISAWAWDWPTFVINATRIYPAR